MKGTSGLGKYDRYLDLPVEKTLDIDLVGLKPGLHIVTIETDCNILFNDMFSIDVDDGATIGTYLSQSRFRKLCLSTGLSGSKVYAGFLSIPEGGATKGTLKVLKSGNSSWKDANFVGTLRIEEELWTPRALTSTSTLTTGSSSAPMYEVPMYPITQEANAQKFKIQAGAITLATQQYTVKLYCSYNVKDPSQTGWPLCYLYAGTIKELTKSIGLTGNQNGDKATFAGFDFESTGDVDAYCVYETYENSKTAPNYILYGAIILSSVS